MPVLRSILVPLLLASVAAGVSAQSSPSLPEQLMGTWTFVLAEITAADGTKSLPFGDTPRGILISTSAGHFAQIHLASEVPNIASNNRLTGTPDD